MAFGNVNTPQGLKELNNFLIDKSYISGYQPSKADISVFDALDNVPAGDYPHVQRWYRHIASFDVKEKSVWSGELLPQVISAKPTVNSSAPAAEAGDDDVDLFGSDEEEDAEAAKIREERVAAYAAKKSKKPALIAKSSVLLDVKPWDDETDMAEMERLVRTVEMDGLLWGASKLVPVGYGINKLQIMCVIEDDKVSIDLLTETIQNFEDFVQSVDIAAFNKI
uniref:Translation elongation factor EF1B beta/delta subunit guanine nucleotide exchange domain-containing protein n=1 Tax=Glossina austeni TaxID=7395 RepID=A0A1A9VX73_GLOAU